MRRGDLSQAVVDRLKRLPPPHAAHYGVVPSAPPEHGVELGDALASLQRATRAMAHVDVLAREPGGGFLVSRLLARREAVSSSAIEGTNSTLDELLSVEEGAADETRHAALQVRDYAIILERHIRDAAADGPAVFTRSLVTTLHAQAMARDPDYRDVPGEIRTRVVWIGGAHDIAYSTYNPAPPDSIEETLSDSVAYMRAEGMQVMTQSLITRMAIAHAHFEAVHPFRDGNGRVGRLLLPLMMAADGQVPLYLAPYIEANKQEYYASLKAAQQKLDWATAVKFMADAVTGTVDELLATRAALSSLADGWRDRRHFRKESAALRALDVLPQYPVITAKRLAGQLEVSAPAALNAIDHLVDAGILKERTGYARNRVFVASEVLSIVNRPFGAAPVLA
ncbi:Fic family protein [Sphingomonas colocasiae]|uniref:Fic family protein n=1 Tax=Sphingomonas colocasiae TaxID=1848973 RepID=A0ABS7PPK1_9SPHN|nr:Fic family protein [Sphingomonas colocasiae]MBY8823253.1 Fic family protein [Sphingomonas colocasiae]